MFDSLDFYICALLCNLRISKYISCLFFFCSVGDNPDTHTHRNVRIPPSTRTHIKVLSPPLSAILYPTVSPAVAVHTRTHTHAQTDILMLTDINYNRNKMESVLCSQQFKNAHKSAKPNTCVTLFLRFAFLYSQRQIAQAHTLTHTLRGLVIWVSACTNLITLQSAILMHYG